MSVWKNLTYARIVRVSVCACLCTHTYTHMQLLCHRSSSTLLLLLGFLTCFALLFDQAMNFFLYKLSFSFSWGKNSHHSVINVMVTGICLACELSFISYNVTFLMEVGTACKRKELGN